MLGSQQDNFSPPSLFFLHFAFLLIHTTETPEHDQPKQNKKISAMYITIILTFKPETQNRTDAY